MNNLSKMIMENSFSKREIPRNLSCTICKKLLNDASKAPCNCLFCWKCIEEFLKNGEIYCPTNNKSCKIQKLSINHIIRDVQINQMVLKLDVICPFSGCSYEDELQKMSDHLRICKERNYCPYYEMGCCCTFKKYEDIIDHLQIDNYLHVNLMIGWVTNMKNEFQSAGHFNGTNILNVVEDKFRQYSEDQRQNEITSNQLSAMFEIEIKSKIENLSEMKSDYDNFRAEFNDFKLQSENKVNQQNNKIQDLQNEIRSLTIKLNSFGSKISFDETPIKIWKINNFQEKIMKNETLLSDFFYSRINRSKLALSLTPDPSKGFISVYIRHYKDESNNIQNLPFAGEFGIRISNQFNPIKQKICQKLCKIPPNDRSEPFKFQRQELINSEILADQIMIECLVSK